MKHITSLCALLLATGVALGQEVDSTVVREYSDGHSVSVLMDGNAYFMHAYGDITTLRAVLMDASKDDFALFERNMHREATNLLFQNTFTGIQMFLDDTAFSDRFALAAKNSTGTWQPYVWDGVSGHPETHLYDADKQYQVIATEHKLFSFLK